MPRRDFLALAPFAGWAKRRFRSSGFFRLERDRRRWWLVTPQGHAFLGFGLNHINVNLLRRKECAGHWAGRFGIPADAPADAFLPGYHRKLSDDLAALGMNHVGVHSPTRNLPPGFCPYIHRIEFVAINHYQTPAAGDFHDVFAPEFDAHCDRIARADALPRARDPRLIAYFFTDCPIFTEMDAAPRDNGLFGAVRPGLPTWPRVLRNLGPTSPGKQAYVAAMRELYHNDIGAFSNAYSRPFESFGALAAAVDWKPGHDWGNAAEMRDNLFFLERIAGRYYSVATAAIRRYDANHLIAGDKLNGNAATPESIIRLAARHIDFVFYQMFGFWKEQERVIAEWSRLSGKAVFNGDVSIAVPYAEMPNPYGPHCRTQEERAARFREFAEGAYARPEFLGLTWCGWIDSLEAYQKGKQHGGVQTPCGDFYKPLAEEMARFSARMYEIAAKA